MTDPDQPVVAPQLLARPRVLELRIHGVNNTTPQDMLELPQAGIEQVDGDDLGSFWAGRPQVVSLLPQGDPGSVPDGVERQAYSWGGLARTSFRTGSGALGTVLAGLGRLGWAVLLPFGLVNIAYWSRRLDTSPDLPAAQQGAGRGASLTRVFGLLLSLLMVVTACELSLDLLAVQCFTPDALRESAPRNLCVQLPSLVDQVARWTLGQRLALFSLLPVALIIALRLLGRISAGRYEAVTVVERPPAHPSGRPGVLLSRPDFWRGARLADQAATLHESATLCIVAFAGAWIARTGEVPRWPVPVLIGSGALLALAVLVHGVRAFDAPDVHDLAPRVGSRLARVAAWLARVPGSLLRVAAWAVLAVELVLLLGATVALPATGSERLPFPFADWVPIGLLAAMVAVGVGACFWRRSGPGEGPRFACWGGTAPGLLLLLAAATGTMLSAVVVVTFANWLNGGHSAVDLLPGRHGPAPSALRQICSAACTLDDPDLVLPRAYPWFAAAALVTLLLLVAELVVLLLVWCLDGFALRRPPGPRSAMTWLVEHLLRPPRARSEATAGQVDEALERLPERRAASRLGLLYFEDAALAAAGPDPAPGAVAPSGAGGPPPPGTPALRFAPGASLVEAATAARRFAAVLQHAETLVGALALAATAGLVLGLYESIRSSAGGSGIGPVENWTLETGCTVVALIGLLVVGAVAGGGAVSGSRPLGIVWDLICVLPRAGHPLGPPCYAERAVPEIVRRVLWWLDGESLEPAGRGRFGPRVGEDRRVVLSAHSLGCVLAVAAVCALPGRDDAHAQQPAGPQPGAELDGGGYVGRVSLVTYGCQLRPYFSRLFPELLGPDILGTTSCAAPATWQLDPWRGQLEAPANPRLTPQSVRTRLSGEVVTGSPRWINLWRRTDHLGFPVLGYRNTPGYADVTGALDRPAEELDTAGYVADVASHGNYPRTLAYHQALADLLGRSSP